MLLKIPVKTTIRRWTFSQIRSSATDNGWFVQEWKADYCAIPMLVSVIANCKDSTGFIPMAAGRAACLLFIISYELGYRSVLDKMSEMTVDNMQANGIRNSVLLRCRDATAFAEEAYTAHGDELVALGFVEKGSFNPKRVFIASQV